MGACHRGRARRLRRRLAAAIDRLAELPEHPVHLVPYAQFRLARLLDPAAERVAVRRLVTDSADRARALGAGLILSRLAPLAQRIGLSLGGGATETSSSAPPAALAGLTAREREVLRLVAAGRSTARSCGAVHQHQDASVHVSNILGKLGVARAARRPQSPTGTACSPSDGRWLAAARWLSKPGVGPSAGRDAGPASRPWWVGLSRAGWVAARELRLPRGMTCLGWSWTWESPHLGDRGGPPDRAGALDDCWMMISVGGVAQARLNLG